MTCPEKYKNLGLQSFGDQKYVTTEMLRQFCMNDAYLKKMVDKLEYLTPPAVRKRFNPLPVDADKSFGYMQNTSGEVEFDTETSKNYTFDFIDDSVIDISKTTAELESILDDSGTVIKQFKVKKYTEGRIIRGYTRNYSPWTIYQRDSNGDIIYEDEAKTIPKLLSDDMTCNEYWYIGFDRNRTYEIRPNWLVNMCNGEIPGISRAQTFIAKSTGKLWEVTLNLKGGTNTGMPLIVQIRKTKSVDGIDTPVDSDQAHLAVQEVRFSNTDPGVYSVTFDHPATVEKGKSYAIVLLSPLSHPTNCYWIGGWNKHCHADVYTDGNAFYSFNCGYTWIRYGKDTIIEDDQGNITYDEHIDYHSGKYAPQDFAFQAYIQTDLADEIIYDILNEYYVYLKPIYSNPIKSVVLGASDKGDTVGDDYGIRYEITQDPEDTDSWVTITPNKKYNFTPDENGEYKNVLFVRAVLYTHDNSQTPILQSLSLTLDTTLPKELYIRTVPYSPPTAGILSADIWGRIYAPFDEEETVECSVEIIRDKEVMEHFIIVEPLDLENYTNIPGIDATKIKGKSEAVIKKYLTDTPSVLEILADNNIYVIGFFNTIKLLNSPAYPLVSLYLQPSAQEDTTINLGEWYDYTVDYTEDTITFSTGALETLKKGTLTVKYNPLFIDGLTAEEVGLTYETDDVGDVKVTNKGLVLDYFQEDFIITEEELETRTLKLRATPVDPVRKVVIIYNNEDDDSEENIELNEEEHYTVDYNNKTINFNIIYSDDESSILNNGDTVRVIYTPNLDDSALSLGYHATRTNTNKKVKIKPNWIEYKA